MDQGAGDPTASSPTLLYGLSPLQNFPVKRPPPSTVQPFWRLANALKKFHGDKWNLTFQFQNTNNVLFEGTNMEFSVNSFTKDN